MFTRLKTTSSSFWGPTLVLLAALTVTVVGSLRSPSLAPSPFSPSARSVAAPASRLLPGIDKAPPSSSSAAPDSAASVAIDEGVAQRQTEFLREAAKKEVTEWRSLTEAQRDAMRAALKTTLLGDD